MANEYEIATWRFEQIAFLIDPSLSTAQRRAELRARTSKQRATKEGVEAQTEPVGRSTLFRWLKLYREHGYIGLLPKPRSDRGRDRRPGSAVWITYAIGLLYEQPDRSLMQLEVYLRVEFAGYSLSRTTLRRRLRRHPAYAGIATLRSGKKRKLRDLYEATHPHEGWQLDGKGPFTVRFTNGKRVDVHVLSVIDDHSREVLAAVVARAEDTDAAIAVLVKAISKWGMPERFQFDRGSAFESHAVRNGLAILGIHRNFVEARSPEWEGKIEAYHRSLDRWFVRELREQEVVDFEHLQQLLEAMLALVYSPHHHRVIGEAPAKRLAGRISGRRVSRGDLERAFFVEVEARSDPKTGEVRLPNGTFRVPSLAHAGHHGRFRYFPGHDGRAVLVTGDGSEVDLLPFAKKALSDVPTRTEKRGQGQLQKLVDVWQGKERPNAQPGFGVPEVFAAFGRLLGREVPHSDHEAHAIVAFYRKHGPLDREGFTAACARTGASLGDGRALTAYLADLERQIGAERGKSQSHHEEDA